MLQIAMKLRTTSAAQMNSKGNFTASDNPACLKFLF